MEDNFLRQTRKFMNHSQEWVSVLDNANRSRRLQDDGPEVWALVERAEVFRYGRTRLTRMQFARLMENLMLPGNVTQIG